MLSWLCCSVVWANQAILPVPAAEPQPQTLVRLGDQLFHDTRLSADNTISCASCHDLSLNGADRRPFSVGVGGALGHIRAPSVYNSVLNHAQFWDGSAADLESQVDGPIHNPVEMATNWESVILKLSQDPLITQKFNAHFRDGITADNIRQALAAFQRTLVLTDSPFDRWLAGDSDALTAEQQRGYQQFRNYGCISCHQGANVGGNMFARMGSLENYFILKGDAITEADLGRFNVTGQAHHRYVFKVPGLRTAALNSFFFHDSSASSLEEAIEIMARFQLGREMPTEHTREIAAFIRSLTGQHPRLTHQEQQ
ncbi:MAG: cytochrome-c peroxidase [Nitrincola lacisaponensis]|uniref:Cytochrome c551 peroxidase n=1 Tax=Nitrincola lacisaponensis TaxID=267850 RepID=A0A063Y9A1_9GAMM|nr:cytochrome c peroxidase [Nitrincola lacisaponensis]KDE41306.1 Cytochrome c551 peroxidase [Nitrincola lacisaponensis]